MSSSALGQFLKNYIHLLYKLIVKVNQPCYLSSSENLDFNFNVLTFKCLNLTPFFNQVVGHVKDSEVLHALDSF